MTDLGLGSWPARRARIAPGRTAFEQGDRRLTYGELAARVDGLAAGLASAGVARGERVAYLGANDVATFETCFAAGRLGAVFVPLNIRLAAAEIAYQLADCAPTVLVHAPAMADLVAAADPVAAGVRGVVTTGPSDASIAGVLGTATLESLIHPGEAVPRVDVGLDDDAVILYTSGTTGRPKGAVLTHGNLTFNTMNQLAHVDVLSTDVALCTAPLFHVTGLGQVSLPTLFKGGTIVMAPRFDAGWMLRVVAERRITAFSAVPTMLQLLCEHPAWPQTDLSSLRYVIYGGSPIAEPVADAWHARGVPLMQGYGMTEASPGVLLTVPGAGRTPVRSAGMPHFFTDVALDRPVGDPPTGELLVRGPNVFDRYWNRPAETAEAFVDGWFRSGDVVRLEPDGSGTIVDRIKEMIISGGENVYPAEIEAALATAPGVAAGAVVAVPDRRWGEVGCAFVVALPGAALDEATVRGHLEQRLARYKIPRYIRFVDELPRTATGKIRKTELRHLAAGDTFEGEP